MPGSHNIQRPSFRGATEAEYKAFFKRVETAFAPSEMTKGRLTEWLNNENMADFFGVVRRVSVDIDQANTIERLNELRKDASSIPIHQDTLLNKINSKIEMIRIEERERKIAESIARMQEFAREREINLSEKVTGRVETWKDKFDRQVIRERGQFKAWKII